MQLRILEFLSISAAIFVEKSCFQYWRNAQSYATSRGSITVITANGGKVFCWGTCISTTNHLQHHPL